MAALGGLVTVKLLIKDTPKEDKPPNKKPKVLVYICTVENHL